MRNLLIAAAALWALSLRAEPDFIDSPAPSGSLAPGLTALGSGAVVLTWLEKAEEGHAFRYATFDDGRFDAGGTIAEGKDWFANWADTPGLFELPNGDWLAHWLVKSGPATYAYDMLMARSRDAGRNWSARFSPHADGTRSEHGFASYYADGNDGAGVVWLDGRETVDDGPMTLRTATIGPDNEVLDGQLLDGRVCDCCPTATARTDAGVVVVYRDRSEDEIRDHRVIRRTGSGWSEPIPLGEEGWKIGGCPVNGPAVTADGDRVAAAWFTMAGGEPRVGLAVSLDAGAEFAPVATLGAGEALGRVDLAAVSDGFVVSWMIERNGRAELRLAEYAWTGRKRWQRQLVRLPAGRVSGFPEIAPTRDDRLLVAWTGVVDSGESQVRTALIDRGPANP